MIGLNFSQQIVATAEQQLYLLRHSMTLARFLLAAVFSLVPALVHANQFTLQKYLIVTEQQASAQSIIRGLCLASLNVSVATNTTRIELTQQRFDEQMNRIVNGDAETGLEGEGKSVIISMLESVDLVWKEIEDEIANTEDFQTMEDEAVLILAERADSLTNQLDRIADMYTMEILRDDDIDFDTLRALTLASDQRTLIESASKKTCLAFRGIYADHMRNELTRDLHRFEKGVFALAFGNHKLSILAPPTEDIQLRSFENWQEWTNANSVYEAAIDGSISPMDMSDLTASTEWIYRALDLVLRDYQELMSHG